MSDELAAAEVPEERFSAAAALFHRDFRLFFTGLVITNTGTWMQLFGLGWLVVELAARDGTPQLGPLYLGLVGLSRALPGLVFGLFAGVVADRVDRRRLLLLTQSTAGVIASVLAALTLTGHINVVLVMALTAASAVAFAFDGPSRLAMVPRLVPRGALVSAIGLASVAFNGATLVGPLIGGLLIGPIGVGGLMAVNAVSYLVIVGALLAMRPMPVIAPAGHASMLDSLREGLAYVRHDAVLRWVIPLVAINSLLARPYIHLLPAVARDVLHVGAVELSWLVSASGAGALAGALVVTSLGGFRRRGLVCTGSAVLGGSALVLFALQHALVPGLVMAAIASFATMTLMGMAQTINQSRAPDHLRGRVMGVQHMTVQAGVPAGTMLEGSLGTLVGVDLAIGLGGAIVALAGAYVFLRAVALREYGTPLASAARS